MKLLELIRREIRISFVELTFVALLAGLTQAMVLAVINATSEAVTNGSSNFGLLLMFMASLVGYIFSQRYLMTTTTSVVEEVLISLRLRMADKIHNSELYAFEHIGRSRIYSGMTKETVTISQSAPIIVVAAQSGIMVIFALAYLAWLSMAVFLITIVFTIIGISIHLYRDRERFADFQRVLERENDFFDLLTHMVEGFKEVKMSELRNNSIVKHLEGILTTLKDLRIKYGHQFASHFIFSQVAFYILIATIGFILSQIATVSGEITVKSTSTVLFLVGPLSNFVGALPAFTNARVAAKNIYKLEKELDKGREVLTGNSTNSVRPYISSINEIVFDDVQFHYVDKSGIPTFSVGPINLALRVGEIVFIVGGNGSGKSTFFKLLTSLYFPTNGTIKINGFDIKDVGYGEYRNLFAVIFSDYHLFDRLYGINDVGSWHIQELLKSMGLDSKTKWENDHFTTLDLSTGQRKRLALLMSFLEDKPIYVFDEWAADQDPNFRKYFYEVILKDLKAQGKTVVVATHDEKYFCVADRVLKMEYGQFTNEKSRKTRRRKKS